MGYVIEPEAVVVLPVAGGGSFPVHQIYCVGRNYADHAVEMGHDPDKEPPFFFMKPDYGILHSGETMTYPALSSDVHHEVELVVALGKSGTDVRVEDAMDLVYGYGVGIDMTRRDLQSEAKDKARPWEAGKAFLHAAPCSELIPITQCGPVNDGSISLSINGEIRQHGNVNQMIWKVPEVISRLSTLFSLRAGDLIYTGTPAGVGPIARGDRIVANIDRVGQLEIGVA
ncbi:MAG: fumarylacetoacetate hydrolase family protein [Proteobacteria bacterium]|nr:fumarylacetoacetate hydrolase family protein [Pseudomonadota bacterium]